MSAARARRLMQRYGITVEQYEKMLAQQGGRCAICRRLPASRRLAVDHDHHDGRVRGLLCFHCNKFFVAKNTLATAKQVVRYLQSRSDGRNL